MCEMQLYCPDCGEERDCDDDCCFDCGSEKQYVEYAEHIRILSGDECDCHLPVAAHESHIEVTNLQSQLTAANLRIAELEGEVEGLKNCQNCERYYNLADNCAHWSDDTCNGNPLHINHANKWKSAKSGGDGG